MPDVSIEAQSLWLYTASILSSPFNVDYLSCASLQFVIEVLANIALICTSSVQKATGSGGLPQ